MVTVTVDAGTRRHSVGYEMCGSITSGQLLGRCVSILLLCVIHWLWFEVDLIKFGGLISGESKA